MTKLSKGKPDAERRAREGRPPSKWLRSLNADEIRIWLKMIDVPPVGVSGMTFETHLTRDHSFDLKNVQTLLQTFEVVVVNYYQVFVALGLEDVGLLALVC